MLLYLFQFSEALQPDALKSPVLTEAKEKHRVPPAPAMPALYVCLSALFGCTWVWTQHDDAGSDSDLSDPGEYEKYGPSNSEDEAVDEFGNPMPKDIDRLPKGVDTSGKRLGVEPRVWDASGASCP